MITTVFDSIVIKDRIEKSVVDFRSLSYQDRREILNGLIKIHKEQSFPIKKATSQVGEELIAAHAKEHGIAPTARKFNISRSKVYRILGTK